MKVKHAMANEGDHDDWNTFYREWGDRLLLFARQQTRSLAEAEDVVQESFVHVWTHRERFPTIEPGLLFTQIRRFAIDRARRHQRREKREQRFEAVRDAPLFDPRKGQEASDLESALEELPPDQQEVLVLKIWGDQSFESIGRTLDIPANTAASRYRYGLERLRKRLKTELFS
jgi:RNA polymerase sigma-70 factor (ECF subfamily)